MISLCFAARCTMPHRTRSAGADSAKTLAKRRDKCAACQCTRVPITHGVINPERLCGLKTRVSNPCVGLLTHRLSRARAVAPRRAAVSPL